MLEAATGRILDKGYYQTSSNEIARRAGVTWCAIQRHFGTRERLLLEVLESGWRNLERLVGAAEIEGDSLEERLHAVLDALAQHYRRAEHIARIEILLDLASAPKTSASTRHAITLHGAELRRAWKPLFDQALGDAASDFELVSYAFTTLRGFLQGDLIASNIGGKPASRRQRDLLVRRVANAIREASRDETPN